MLFPVRTSTALLCLACTCVQAETQRELDSHEHGGASLDIVLDGNTLWMDLASPWANLVGFEHEPSDDAQRQAVDEALAALRDDTVVFAFVGDAGCSLASVDIDSSMGEPEVAVESEAHGHDDEHDDEGHAEAEGHDEAEGHAEADGHDEAAGHDEASEHEHSEGAEHSEVLASYQYQCEDPAQLQGVDAVLFERWPGFESVRVQLAGPGGQSAAQLDAANTQIDMTQVQ